MRIKNEGLPEEPDEALKRFTAEESDHFKVGNDHQRNLIKRARKTFVTGLVAGLLWVTVSFVFMVMADLGGVDATTNHTYGLSLDLSAKILAVVATLVVAVAVAVRSLGEPNEKVAPIEMARRKSLTFLSDGLAIGACALATVASFPVISPIDYSPPAAVAELFVSLAISVLAADASIQFGQAQTAQPKYDRWVQLT
jgi:hypothetical protein